MTTLKRLQLEQSEKRQRINELLGITERTDDQTTELDTLTKRMQSLELELRAAIVAEPDPATVETRTDQDAEGRERRELIGRCRVGRYFAAVAGQATFDGAEAELGAELGMGANSIPLALFARDHTDDLERRAATPVPGTVGLNMQAIEQMVFAPSIAMRLGISVRDVPSGTAAIPTVTTAPAGHADNAGGPRPKAKDGASDATAGAITVVQATPKRIPAKLSVRLEDIAAFGNDTFEMALREALQLNLSHAFDNQIINGSGAGANLTGLIARLTAPTAQGAEVTWQNAQEVIAAFVDGTWASMLSELAVAVNPEAYRKAASTFQAPVTEGARGEVSLASYLMEKLADFFTNSRMPDTASSGTLDKNAALIVCRKGQEGATRAVVPSWGRIAIDDPYTNSDTGLRNFVVSLITGDLMLVHSDAFALGAWQVQA